MTRFIVPAAILLAAFRIAAAAAAAPEAAAAADTRGDPARAWIAKSNALTRKLLHIDFEHSPESASQQGLAEFDARVSAPSLADDRAQRRELQAALEVIAAQEAAEPDRNVREDVEILRKAFDLRFRNEDFALQHKVPFFNASSAVFQGLRVLLDDQVAESRRAAAVIRLRRYAGLEAGYKPYTELLQAYAGEQMAKPGVVYPAREELETELGRNSNYVEELPALFRKYHLAGWEQPFARLKTQLAAYDAWLRAQILPKARSDFRLPPQEYALALEGYGVDLAPARIAAMAHAAFGDYQNAMGPLAAKIAKARGYKSADYRDVIRELKKQQITGESILPFFDKRLHEIEAIVRDKRLVTLPSRPAVIRLATAAETAAQPAPHMKPPPMLENSGQRGEFVLPLNIPSPSGGEAERYDDFTFDAVSWTLTAHEARPGHELQFDSMVEHGVSLARALYAANSTNVEGWGLYAEWIMQPYEPDEAQLCTLQLRLLRAARAFLDPELQSGIATPAHAYEVLEKDVVLSHAFAKEEVERFTYRSPGQANSYFYGYTRLLALRKQTEGALGARFDAMKFHDFILGQGLLPPDLVEKAVREEFVPAQK